MCWIVAAYQFISILLIYLSKLMKSSDIPVFKSGYFACVVVGSQPLHCIFAEPRSNTTPQGV